MSDNPKPVKEFRIGRMKASVWKNDNGFSVTLQKSYKDRDGEWQKADSLFHDDVVCAIRVMERVERFMAQ